jgi:hypothetical protein
MRHVLPFLAGSLLGALGCAGMSVNKDPNILSQAPYDQVKYVARLDDTFEEVAVVQVTTRGMEANLLNTIPQLYKRALDEHGTDERTRFLTGIEVSAFTQREPFQVPYQDCKTEFYTENVPYQSCNSGYGTMPRTCTTQYRMEQRSRQKCETRYRTEIRNVLYQKAMARVLRRK